MASVRPVLQKLLIAALVAYVISSCAMLTNLYLRVNEIEHVLLHFAMGDTHQDHH